MHQVIKKGVRHINLDTRGGGWARGGRLAALTGIALSAIAAGCGSKSPTKEQIVESLGQPMVTKADIDVALTQLFANKLSLPATSTQDIALNLAAAHAHSGSLSVEQILGLHAQAKEVVGDSTASRAVYKFASHKGLIPSMDAFVARIKEFRGLSKVDDDAALELALLSFQTERAPGDLHKLFFHFVNNLNITPLAAAEMTRDFLSRFAAPLPAETQAGK